jgi:Na+/proline symporter
MSTAVADGRLYDFNQGALNLASLALLPLCWQFSDVTMWQRLGAVRLPPPDQPNRFSAIKKGLLRYAIESPITWILAIIAGIALRYADIGITEENVWNGLAEIPVTLMNADTPAGSVIQLLVASLFAAGIVAAMLSTADSFLIGSAFTIAYDLAPRVTDSETDIIAQNPRRALRLGRIAVIIFIVAGLASYWIASLFGFDILSILFGAFAAQASLFPAVFGTIVLRDRAPARGWALASIVGGFVGALIAVGVALTDPAWALYPPLFALGASIPVYAVGAFLKYGSSGGPYKP